MKRNQDRNERATIRNFESAVLSNPHVAEIRTERTAYGFTFYEVLIAMGFGFLAGGIMGLIVYSMGMIGVLIDSQIEPFVIWVTVFVGSIFGFGGFIWRTWEHDRNRYAMNEATFHEPPKEPGGGMFVKETGTNRTTMHRLWVRSSQIITWANQLPLNEWNMAYSIWTGTGKVFSRNQFKKLRELLVKLDLVSMNPQTHEIERFTTQGERTITLWAEGRFSDDVLIALRRKEK